VATVTAAAGASSGGECPANISAAWRRRLGERSKTERRRRAVATGDRRGWPVGDGDSGWASSGDADRAGQQW